MVKPLFTLVNIVRIHVSVAGLRCCAPGLLPSDVRVLCIGAAGLFQSDEITCLITSYTRAFCILFDVGLGVKRQLSSDASSNDDALLFGYVVICCCYFRRPVVRLCSCIFICSLDHVTEVLCRIDRPRPGLWECIG